MKLSVVTINYNNYVGLHKTISSVVAQTCHDFEWIVIDGGSTDGSKELIKKNSDHFAYWCSEPDKGIYNAMNKGITHAQGEYLLFLNSGDFLYDKNVLENCLCYLKDYDIITGDTLTHYKNGTIGIWRAPRLFSVYKLVFSSLSHQSTFIHSQLLRKRPYREDLQIVSDWEQLLYELVFNDATYTYIPITISVFHEDGISHSDEVKERHEKERNTIIQSYFSKRLLATIKGENELQELANKIEVETVLYRMTIWGVKIMRKLYDILPFHLFDR